MPQKKTTLFEIELASNPREIIKVERFLEKMNEALHLEEGKYNKLMVAVTEAVNNGMIHGNKRDPKKKVLLWCEVLEGILWIHVHDEGPGVDPDSLPDPLAEENLLRENGRGVFLMRSLMDKVSYSQNETGCSVTMSIALDA